MSTPSDLFGADDDNPRPEQEPAEEPGTHIDVQ